MSEEHGDENPNTDSCIIDFETAQAIENAVKTTHAASIAFLLP